MKAEVHTAITVVRMLSSLQRDVIAQIWNNNGRSCILHSLSDHIHTSWSFHQL